jgi:predicted metalloendopeptidase
MNNKNGILILTVALAISATVLSCGQSVKTPTEQAKNTAETNTAKVENNSVSTSNDAVEPAVKKAEKSVKDKKADFMVTAVVINQEFRAKGKKDEDFSKYKNKVIQIGGVINAVYPDKKDSIQPHLSFSDGGFGMASTCYFDDEDAPKLKEMKEHQAAMLKCFLDAEDIFAGLPPTLRHCVTVETK